MSYLSDLIKKPFLELIEWEEPEAGFLLAQYPMAEREIRIGAKLKVGNGQLALFVQDGRVADLFGPGLHAITPSNLPLLSQLKKGKIGFASPFKSDVVFFSTGEQAEQRWGTGQALTLREEKLGPISMRAHGTFAYKILDPRLFYQTISGTRSRYRAVELDSQLRSLIQTGLSAYFQNHELSFAQLKSDSESLSRTLQEVLVPTFAPFGLELRAFRIHTLTLPKDCEKAFQGVEASAGDFDRLERLHALLLRDIITREEFTRAKGEILARA